MTDGTANPSQSPLAPKSPKRSPNYLVIVILILVIGGGMAYVAINRNKVLNTNSAAPDTSPVPSPTLGVQASPTATPTPAKETRRETIGKISMMIPAGYQARENASLLQAAKLSAVGANIVGAWMIVPDSFDALQNKIQTGEITEQEAAQEGMKTAMAISVLEEKNPDQEDLNALVEKRYPQASIESENLKFSKDTLQVAGKTVEVRMITSQELGSSSVVYNLQLEPKGNIISVMSFELVARPFKKQVEDLIRSIEL